MEAQNQKKKKKKVKLQDNADLALRRSFAGSKPENETIRVINNYRGMNTIHSGKRVLKRLGPQGQGPLPPTSVPPWIGPCYYPNKTADEYLYGNGKAGIVQASFKAVGRETKSVDEFREDLSIKREWSGLFSGENSVYGPPSIPFSAKSTLNSHSECQGDHDDSNVWSKMSSRTTMGAKQVTNHYENPPTPYFGHKTIRTSSPKRRRKGIIDGDENNSSRIDIHRERIFDAALLDEMYSEDNPAISDDASLATSVFGNEEFDMNSVGSSSSLSTRKRYDAISLLSKSVNFSVYTGFSVDKVMKNFVAKQKMKYDVRDYTMGALGAYNDSVSEELVFTDPRRGNASGHTSLTQSPMGSPRAFLIGDGLETPQSVSPRGLNRQLVGISSSDDFGSSDKIKSGRKKRSGSIVKNNPGLLSLEPQSTADSVGHVRPRKITEKDIAAAPGRQTYRRTAITPVPLPNLSNTTGLLGTSPSESRGDSAQEMSSSYNNFKAELTRSRSNILSKSNSKLGALEKQSSLSTLRVTRQKTSENISKSFSRSMSKLTVEDQRALETTGVGVNLGGLLLPGEGIDVDGTASFYSPPETPREVVSSGNNEEVSDDEADEDAL